MELKKEIESLLFSSGKVMSVEDLADLTQKTKKDVSKALEDLKKDYEERDTSLIVIKQGNGWKLNVKEKYINLVTKIVADTELPFPILETLAIIVYKSPAAMQSEIVKIRGTNAYEHISELIERDFIERKKQGRSYKVFLTTKFFEYFDVEGDKDIKEYLKDAQPVESSKHVTKKLGKLDVVDVPEEKQEKSEDPQRKLGDLKVIDTKEKEENEFTPGNGITADDVKPDNNFISDIESKIDALSKRNDEIEKDESFKRHSSDELPSDEENNKKDEEDKEESEKPEPQQEDKPNKSNDIFGDEEDTEESDENISKKKDDFL